MKWLVPVLMLAIVGCGGAATLAEEEPPKAETAGGMATSPAAGPVAPVDSQSKLGGGWGGGGVQGQIAKDRAKSAAAKAGESSVGRYGEAE
ncbi:MAG: hypothetical protein KIT74_05850 [Fimbriimonadales bacterium]|nr:hypothetical protein [Fimbriimonadales bacterium]